MRIRSGLWLALVYTLAAASCSEGTTQQPQPGGALDTAGMDGAAMEVDLAVVGQSDPGPPGEMYGPKCLLSLDGQPTRPGCISGVYRNVGTTLQLFLNFCTRNEIDECNGSSPLYVSLVLPISELQEGRWSEAIAGRVTLQLPTGLFEIATQNSGPIPLQFDVFRQEHEAIPEGYLRARLTITVPGRDAALHPVTLTAEIN